MREREPEPRRRSPHAALTVALAAAGSSAGCAGDPPSDPVEVRVELAVAAAEVDPRFLSIAIDTAQVVGGVFWDPGGGVEGAFGSVEREPFDFERPALRRLAAALAPAYLRIGGSEADRVYYDLGEPPLGAPPEGYEEVLTRAQWDDVTTFAGELGLELVFTLNAGPAARDTDGRWDPSNAEALLARAAVRGDPVAVWELGNEVNAYPFIFYGTGIEVGPETLAADVATLRATAEAAGLGADLRIGGPASAYWPVVGEVSPFLEPFLAALDAPPDVVTWHYYPQQSRRCAVAVRRAGPRTLLAPRNLDELARWSAGVEAARATHAPDAELWLGETGNAQCGGEPGVSDAHVGSLWWVDELGQLARRGHAVVVRQTLAGSNYGLLDEETLAPRPDYWASLLWKRLMGTTVLDARSSDARVRVYAHCAADAPGGVALALVNLREDAGSEVALALPGATAFERYVVHADGLGSATVALHGVELALSDDELPPLEPEITTDAALTLPPASYAFVVARGVRGVCDEGAEARGGADG